MSGADLFDDEWPFTHGTVDGYDKGGCRGGSCPAAVEHGLSCKRAKQLDAGDYRYKRLVREGKNPAEIAEALAEAPHETAAALVAREVRTTPSAARPLAERAQDAAPQEDAGAPAIEREAPAEATPAAEAEAMGHHPTPEETPAMPTPADVAKNDKPLNVTPVAEHVDEQPEPTAALTTDKWTHGLTTREKRTKLAEIRDWCRRHGFPGVPNHGRIPHDALAAYDAAHEPPTAELTMDASPLAKARQTLTEVALATGGQGLAALAAEPVIIPEEVAERIEAHIDEELAQLNADADGEPDLPEQQLEPAEFAQAFEQADDRAGISAGAGPILDDQPRPEWAEVAISVDVERARNLAARLEQELAHTEEQLRQAHAAVETVLQKWAADTEQLQAQIGQLIIEAGIATGTANLWADLYRSANDECARLRVAREQTFAGELERFLSPPEAPAQKRRRRTIWRNS